MCYTEYVGIGITGRQKHMRKDEKLYLIISFILGILMLCASASMYTCNARIVCAAETDAEDGDQANSWRYNNGKLMEDSAKKNKSAARQVTRPSNATAQGIDVSYHNGKINWEEVKNSGQVDYAILRCGYGQDLVNQDDSTWAYNASECERLGIPYGVYLYSYATNAARAKSEAQHVIRLLQGKTPTYPIYYDLEDKTLENMSPAQLGENASVFFNTLKAAGYTNVGVYGNTSWFTNKLTAPVFSQYPKWVAQYNTVCAYTGGYHMWQYTNTGSIPGISGNVDLNFKIGNWKTATISMPTVSMNKKSISLTAGKKYTLKASYTRQNNYTSKVTWTTSNKNIATVSGSGLVTAKAAGKVTITATISNGKKAYCTVTVKPKTNKIKKLKKSGTKSVKIYWTKVSGTTKYQIYMSTKKSSGYKKIKTTSAKSSSYTKGKLKRKKRYYFKVRSYKKVGGKYYYSSFSSVKSIRR